MKQLYVIRKWTQEGRSKSQSMNDDSLYVAGISVIEL